MCQVLHYTLTMIKSFRNRGLRTFFLKGKGGGMRQDLQNRVRRKLDKLDKVDSLGQLNIPGFDFHALRGKPKRYSIHVNGPWCITFEWDGENAIRVDLENYH